MPARQHTPVHSGAATVAALQQKAAAAALLEYEPNFANVQALAAVKAHGAEADAELPQQAMQAEMAAFVVRC